MAGARRRRKSQFMLAEMQKRRQEVSGHAQVRHRRSATPKFKMFGGGKRPSIVMSARDLKSGTFSESESESDADADWLDS